jgi:tetratricopeptide (TPR) repeat protein
MRCQNERTAMYHLPAMWRILLLFASLVVPVLAVSAGQAPAAKAPQSAEDHLNLAKRYISEQKTDLAIDELKRVTALEPANVEARGDLGVLLYFRGDYAEAIPELRAAAKAQRDLWKIQALLGMAENRVGDQEVSRVDLETAFPHLTEEKIQLDAGGVLLGIYANSGDLDKASELLSTLLVVKPTDSSLLYLSYRIHSDLANRAILTMAIANPGSAELHQAMARELAKQGKTDEAIANYREALRINPRLPEAHTELGDLFYHSMDETLKAEATGEFQAALDVNPRDEKAKLAIGVLAAQRGDLKTAYDDDSSAVKADPNDTDACTELAKVLIQMNRKDEARKLLEHAVEIDPSNYVAHFRLGTLYRQQGRTDEAKHQVELYLSYKQMHEKLEKIARTMRASSSQEEEELNSGSRQ